MKNFKREFRARQCERCCKSKGFAMMELMVGLSVMALVLMAAVRMGARAQNINAAHQDAEAMQAFSQLVAQYWVANQAAIQLVMTGQSQVGSTYCATNVSLDGSSFTPSFDAVKHTCVIDSTLLQSKGLWPQSMPTQKGNDRWVAAFRQVTQQNVPTGGFEVFMFMSPLQNGQLMTQGSVKLSLPLQSYVEQFQQSMSELGAMGGFVPPLQSMGNCLYNDTVRQACGRMWSVVISDFL
jgi:prepilin-type N-terminal cleavage/methylation domain-containing protein